ncbi:uncharacterized protein LOC143275702 isoform X2 [Babylonia areolata]|uniref:uncharacterized protein LOC143275702 isoform X2 n=1 Tax=Babylonia areolata TaxID=304850 RepID=UPI003FD6AF2C
MSRNSRADPGAPALPPRPGASRAPLAVPLEAPEAEYDDLGNDAPQDVYDDCEENPPPLPPHPETPEAYYDDVGAQESPQPSSPPLLPQRPHAGKPVPPLIAQQVPNNDGGPIVQHLPRRQLPPPPVSEAPPAQTSGSTGGSVYELDDDGDGVATLQSPTLPPPPPPLEDPGHIYEMGAEDSPDPEPPMPPAPELPPKLPPHPHPKLPTQTAPKATKPGTAAKPPGGIALNMSDLQNVMKGLRKVSVDDEGGPPPSSTDSSHDPKIYGPPPVTVQDAKKLFQTKSDNKPGQVKQSSFDKANAHPPASPGQVPQQAAKPMTRPPPDLDDQEIYDDAASFVPDPLARYDWYHGDLQRTIGDQRVRAVGQSGAFLVRMSAKDPRFPYTLVVFHNGQVNNLRIRKRLDGKVALGDEKPGEVSFESVPMLIEHHQKHPVVLLGNAAAGQSQAHVKLQHLVRKS